MRIRRNHGSQGRRTRRGYAYAQKIATVARKEEEKRIGQSSGVFARKRANIASSR